MKNLYSAGFMRKYLKTLAVAVCLNFCLVHAVFAQEDNTNEKSTETEFQLEGITVTAQKQEENVQEVPVSISVFNEQSIEDLRIESVKDIADFVPNLMLFDNGQPGVNSPSMRGIHATVESFTVSTGLYVNGVPMLLPVGFDAEMYDIERIEVLRGPQGTLYGKNTEAGAINIITRLPDNNFRGKISVEVGEDEKRQVVATVSGPLVKDELFFGVSGRIYQKDGFIEHVDTGETMDDKKRWSGRAHIRWTPTDKLDISLIASHFQYDDEQINTSMTDMAFAQYGLSNPGYRKVASDMDGEFTSTDSSQALKVTYDLDDALTLTSVTTQQRYDDKLKMDYDFNPYHLSHSDKDSVYSKFSQELRLNSSSDRLDWLVGLYFDKDHDYENLVASSIYPSMASTIDLDVNADSYAAFIHLSYALTERLTLVGGLRYEQSESELEDNTTGSKFDESWSAVTPKVAAEYRFTPSVLAYANVSQGYRSGGFNYTAFDPQYYSFDSETLWSYEAGVKSTLNNRIILNGAAYIMKISDMQVSEAISALESYTTNAAEATATGAELEITAKVIDELTLMAGYGYSNIEFDSFEDVSGDYKGKRAPYAPEYTYSIGVQYRHESGFYARGDVAGYGKMYFDKANKYSRDPYQVVNAKIGYELNSFDVYLYAKNLFDEEYDSEGYYSGYYIIYSDPREVGVQAAYRF